MCVCALSAIFFMKRRVKFRKKNFAMMQIFLDFCASRREQPHKQDNALRQGDSDDDDDDDDFFSSAREKFTPSASVLLPRLLLLLFVVGPFSRRIWIREKSDGRDDFFVFFISPNNNNNTSTSISDDRHE